MGLVLSAASRARSCSPPASAEVYGGWRLSGSFGAFKGAFCFLLGSFSKNITAACIQVLVDVIINDHFSTASGQRRM